MKVIWKVVIFFSPATGWNRTKKKTASTLCYCRKSTLVQLTESEIRHKGLWKYMKCVTSSKMQMVNRGCEEVGERSQKQTQSAGPWPEDNLWFAASCTEERDGNAAEMREELVGRFLCKAQSQRAPRRVWEPQRAGTAHRAQHRLSPAQIHSSNSRAESSLWDKQLSSAPAWGWWWCCLTAQAAGERPGSHLTTEIWAETLWNKPLTPWIEIEFRLK